MSTSIRVDSIIFDNTIYYKISHLIQQLGYSPYELTHPKKIIRVQQLEDDIMRDDPIDYIQQEEFMTWLEWKVNNSQEEKFKQLYEFLNNDRSTTRQ